MHTYTDLYLAHPLESWTPFDIVVNSAYALLTMPVTYKPTNVVNSLFIRYSGTSAYRSRGLRGWTRSRSNCADLCLCIGRSRIVIFKHPRIIITNMWCICISCYLIVILIFIICIYISYLHCWICWCLAIEWLASRRINKTIVEIFRFIFFIWNFRCQFLFISHIIIFSFFAIFRLGSSICLYLHLSSKGYLFTCNRKPFGVVVFDSMECMLTARFIGVAPAGASSQDRTSPCCNCWQLSAVIPNDSLGSFEISSYRIAGIFLSGIELSFVWFALSIKITKLCISDWIYSGIYSP